MNQVLRAFTFLALSLFPMSLLAADLWPGEAWQKSKSLTHLDSDFSNNLSGSHWNPVTRTLWVCVNSPGKFWALVEDGKGNFKVEGSHAASAKWLSGRDFEGITQANYSDPYVYIIDESTEQIIQYDVSDLSKVSSVKKWDIGDSMPSRFRSGPEGIAFVPDEWLQARKFVDKQGHRYTSKNGMRGLMFVAHQNGGKIYVFDLNTSNNDFEYVGSYKTSRDESSGLEFDRSSGLLYIWHNTDGNRIEVTDLSSIESNGERKFTQIKEYQAPKSGNIEGFAMTPASSDEKWAFLVDDDNQDGFALMWYQQFEPDYSQ